MAKIKCAVTVTGMPDKYITVIRYVRQYSGLGLKESKAKVDKLVSSGTTIVETETKKAAVALIKELTQNGMKASYVALVN